MIDILIFLVLIGIIALLGFMFYSFLSKVTQKGKGKTKIKWKIALYKILQIEFESEHDEKKRSK